MHLPCPCWVFATKVINRKLGVGGCQLLGLVGGSRPRVGENEDGYGSRQEANEVQGEGWCRAPSTVPKKGGF